MYYLYQYFDEYKHDNGEVVLNSWVLSAAFSLEADCDKQIELFQSHGISPLYLTKITDERTSEKLTKNFKGVKDQKGSPVKLIMPFEEKLNLKI